jgi:trypsin
MGRWIAGLTAAVLLLLGSPAHANDTRPDIVGGQPAAITDVPWQVALVRSADPDNYAAQFCGGSIIGTTWIVTAAHCLDGVLSASDVSVLAGTTSLRGAGPRLTVAELFTHPGWDPISQRNDVALLRLASPIALNGTTTAPVNLPVAQDPMAWPARGDSALISGWGDDGFSFPDSLNKATVEVLAAPSDPVCGLYGSAFDASSMLCAGLPLGGIDSCQGDSGGPLVVNVMGAPVLAGITSWGRDCAQVDYPGVYSRVLTYTAWITSTTAMSGQLSVDTTSLSFGPLQVGNTSAQTVTITNVGSAGQPLTSVTVGGTDPAEFLLSSSTCPGYLPSGSACAMTVTFQPTHKGAKSAVLNLGPTSMTVALLGDAKPLQPSAVSNLRAKARKRTVSLTWTPAPDATRYAVRVTGKNQRGKRVTRNLDVAVAKAKVKASLTRRFTVCVVASNEMGDSPRACRGFRRK